MKWYNWFIVISSLILLGASVRLLTRPALPPVIEGEVHCAIKVPCPENHTCVLMMDDLTTGEETELEGYQ